MSTESKLKVKQGPGNRRKCGVCGHGQERFMLAFHTRVVDTNDICAAKNYSNCR